MLDILIFSKDRACQLDLLLRSLKHRFREWQEASITVLYTYSNADLGRGYELVRAEHPKFEYRCELETAACFRELTLGVIGRNEHLAFLVDDDVFRADFTTDCVEYEMFASDPQIMCLSLRLDPNMDYCYPRNRPMRAPRFAGALRWEWRAAEHDWGYPMSLDGHVFRSAEIVPLIRSIEFHDPNSLEAALANSPLGNPEMICFARSKLVNLPINRVQDTVRNRHGSVDAIWLNRRFLDGERISEQTVANASVRGPHAELPLIWESSSTSGQTTQRNDHERPVGAPAGAEQTVVVMFASAATSEPLARCLEETRATGASLIFYAPDRAAKTLASELERLASRFDRGTPGSIRIEVLAVPAADRLHAIRNMRRVPGWLRVRSVVPNRLLRSMRRFVASSRARSDALGTLVRSMRRFAASSRARSDALDTFARRHLSSKAEPVDGANALAVPDLAAAPTPVRQFPLPAAVAHRPAGWETFVDELWRYRHMPGAEAVLDEDLNPQLNDRTPGNPYDQHYFFQDVWAARRVADVRPARHVDVGSRVDLVGFLTALTEVVFVDIRKLDAQIEGLQSIVGSVLAMPFPDRSLASVSCLHVAEHIGLGRYGDPLDPLGTIKAIAELQRVVAPGGQLLFSVPVGRPRTCFNAHRIHDPIAVPQFFDELQLVEFSGVDDRGRFRRFMQPTDLAGAEYACGMYLFRRPE